MLRKTIGDLDPEVDIELTMFAPHVAQLLHRQTRLCKDTMMHGIYSSGELSSNVSCMCI